MKSFQSKIMGIIDDVGIIKVDWAAKELKISEEDASMILEGLRRKGDLAGTGYGYARRK